MTPIIRRLVLIAVACGAYWVGFGPSQFVLKEVLGAFHNPPYQGVWILIPHVFLYSTTQALICFALWIVLAKSRWLPPVSLSFSGRALAWGLAAGVASVIAIFGYFPLTGQANALHAPQINAWAMTANIFSNFYEEYIYRGFMLAILSAALGFWPAAILSSIAFAAVHTQYPLDLRATIATLSILWAFAALKAKSLLAPYLAHMTLDWLVDPFVS